MASITHATVTLTGSAQQLSATLPKSVENMVLQVWIQPKAANTGVVYIGGAGVSASDYGVRLEIPDTSIPSAPFSPSYLGSPAAVSLADIWVIGTAADALSVLIVGYPKV